MTDFIKLLRIEGAEINTEFEKASIKGKGTPQEIADFREGYFKTFIERYFPFPYKVTKGGVIDTAGNKSDSIDCIICNPNHPHTIDNSGKHSIIFADGVDSVIEVKPDLQNKKELERGLQQIQSVKKLKRHITPLFKPQTDARIEHSLRIPCFIFSLKAKSNIDDTMNEIYQYYKLNSIPLEEQFDYIVINGRGILCNYKLPELNRRYIGTSLPRHGYWFEEMNELTFAGFLLYLDIVDPAIPRMAQGILERNLGSTANLASAKRYNIEDYW